MYFGYRIWSECLHKFWMEDFFTRQLDRCSLTGIQVTGAELGDGPYSIVVELEWQGLKCAGKMLDPLLHSNQSLVKKFAEECRLLSTLRHPNVVNFLGLFTDETSLDPFPMIVMELLSNELSDCIEQYGILPDEISHSILYDISLGLNYLHCQTPSIMHRNLTSNNILLTSDMRTAKIAGFFTAKPDNGLDMIQMPGNISFMPPEVFVQNGKYDKSIDLFSFGVVMIHVLSGKFPTPDKLISYVEYNETVMDLSCHQRFNEHLCDIGDDHPLMDLILKCISDLPAERGDASDIVLRLKNRVPSLTTQLDASTVATKNKQMAEQRAEEAEAALQDALNYAQRNADRLLEAESRVANAEARLKDIIQVANHGDSIMDSEYNADVERDGAQVAGASPLQVAALRGIDVCAETTLIVTNSSQQFHWKEYGLKLCIPNKCLPANVQHCTLTIMASLSGQYEFPQGSDLVSAVYWLRCEPLCEFAKAISVELQHCALKKNASKLNIVKSVCKQEKLPYVFQKLGGSFTEYSSYGYIELTGFSGLATTQDESDEKEYCAGLYYLEKRRLNPEIHFVVVWNDDAHLTPVQKQYIESERAMKGPHYVFSFESDVISLDIPSEGVAVGDVWRIEPLTPLHITKKQVDRFKPRRQVPCCQMQAILTRQPPLVLADIDKIPVLTRRVVVQGTRHVPPPLFLTISFIPSLDHKESKKPSIKHLFIELMKIADSWQNIGVLLDIDPGKLKVVEANEKTVYGCLREMLRLWLTMTSPTPSWAILATAIDHLGYNSLALDLRKNYIFSSM